MTPPIIGHREASKTKTPGHFVANHAFAGPFGAPGNAEGGPKHKKRDVPAAKKNDGGKPVRDPRRFLLAAITHAFILLSPYKG